ncbi:hypothetical protein ID866_7314 [Astraeus odoratus]|nr:hypothetical protein ID866_7314 [Astraeus odoratus]
MMANKGIKVILRYNTLKFNQPAHAINGRKTVKNPPSWDISIIISLEDISKITEKQSRHRKEQRRWRTYEN